MAYDHKLPEVVIPDGDVCIPVLLPNDPDYIALFLGVLRTLTLDKHYQRDPNFSALTVRQQWQDRTITPLIETLTQGNTCEDSMSFELRQSETDSCILEQSTDGGITWTTAFNYADCQDTTPLNSIDVENFIDDISTVIANDNATFDGSIESIAPELVYDVTETQANTERDLALCASLREIVDIACDITIEWKRQQGILLGGLAFVVGALVHALIIAGVIASGGSGAGVGIVISGYVVGAITALLTDYSIDVLSDAVARETVACCMFEAMNGQTISLLNFANSLDNCNFVELSNEAQIAGLISILLDEDTDDSLYVQFLKLNADFYELAQVGGIPDCACIWDVCSHWVRLQNPYPTDFSMVAGTYYSWSDDIWSQGAGIVNAKAHLRYDAPSPINHVQTWVKGLSSVDQRTGHLSKYFIELRYLGVVVASFESPSVWGNNIDRVYSLDYSGLVDQVDIIAQVWTNQTLNYGAMRIDEVKIKSTSDYYTPTGEFDCG